MLDIRSIQFTLSRNGYYTGALDGIAGKATVAAISAALTEFGIVHKGWSQDRLLIAAAQWTMLRNSIDAGEIDGFAGPATVAALEAWQNSQRNSLTPPALIAHMPDVWPRQLEMQDFYGRPGKGLTSLELPYPMRLAWDTQTRVTKITIHKLCADSAARALISVLASYGEKEIKALGLDLFGGCFANRTMRGGRRISTHAFGAALDIDPMHNQLRWGADRARMAGKEYAPFIDAFEAEGWISLGRERNYDWMHFQAARL